MPFSNSDHLWLSVQEKSSTREDTTQISQFFYLGHDLVPLFKIMQPNSEYIDSGIPPI